MTSMKLITDGTFGNIYASENGDIIKRNKRRYCSSFLRELAFSQFYNTPKDVKIQMPDICISYENLGIPLNKLYSKLNDVQKKFIISEIIKQVRVLHNNNIYHGDLMPGNILYDGIKVSIIDYGMSSFSVNTKRNVYNDYFKSPESVKVARAGVANDIWAIGCIIMLFYSKNLNVIQGIHQFYNKPIFPFCLMIKDNLILSLIKMCICDVGARGNIDDLYKVMFGGISPPIYTKWNYFYDIQNDNYRVRLYKYLYITRFGFMDLIIERVGALCIDEIYKFNITNNILMYLLLCKSYAGLDIISLINNCISINYAIFDIDTPTYTTSAELTKILNTIYPYFITKPNPIINKNNSITYGHDVYKLCMFAYLIK